jgi:hypothetical protein
VGCPAGRGAGHGHLVEPEAAGEPAGREAERPGEPLGEMALQSRLPAIHNHGEQLLPYDGDHLAALDVAEQILPIEVVTAAIHGRGDLISVCAKKMKDIVPHLTMVHLADDLQCGDTLMEGAQRGC